VCTDCKQTKGCDVTTSPNDGSPSGCGDSNFDPNYSLSVNSYSDSSDSNSSSLHEVKLCLLNRAKNVQLAIGRKKQCKSNKSKKEPLIHNVKKPNWHEIHEINKENLKITELTV